MSEPKPNVRIEIVDYDPRWPFLFEEERTRVADALGGMAECIEHIGSTSVPNLSAKAIIDLLVIVPRLGTAEEWYVEPLKELGYTFFPALGNADRHMFGKGSPHTHHLHIVQRGGDEQARPLAFRDYLRLHPGAAQDYAALKRTLAERYRHDRAAYNLGKTDFIRSIEARARMSIM